MDISIEGATYRSSCPELTRPRDFYDFWNDTLQELAKIDISCRIKQTREHKNGLTEQWFEFESLGNIPVMAYSLLWNDDEPRPLLVYTHGYAGQCDVMLDWAAEGMNIIGVDLRGMGRSRALWSETSPLGYVLTGIESPQQSILRGVISDFIRSYEIARHVFPINISRTIFHGHSFGGAISIMATAVTGAPDLLVSAVPTLGWTQGRLQLVKQGSGLEVNRYLQQHPQRKAATLKVLSYFDTMNFADMVRCPTLIGVGEQDEIVPAATVYAIVNHLQCPVEIREFPFSHSEREEESLWDQFGVEWLQLAASGISNTFGQGNNTFRYIGP